MQGRPVDVAVAVFTRADGCVLLGRRPDSKVYAGYWEFPGGKVDPGETTRQALQREANEELAVEIEEAYPWITREFTYPHATVRLHFYRVRRWRGEVRATEHQALAWRRPDAVDVAPLLPANLAVLRGLSLPHEYAISQAGELGIEPFLLRLRARLEQGLALIQIREPELSREQTARRC
jgi:8-oxo-dGTP diphosphatase